MGMFYAIVLTFYELSFTIDFLDFGNFPDSLDFPDFFDFPSTFDFGATFPTLATLATFPTLATLSTRAGRLLSSPGRPAAVIPSPLQIAHGRPWRRFRGNGYRYTPAHHFARCGAFLGVSEGHAGRVPVVRA